MRARASRTGHLVFATLHTHDAVSAVWHARGCPQCFSTGYRGRVPLAENLVIDEGLRRLIVGRAHPSRIQEAAVAGGMVPIFADGLAKVAQGQTTLEEVLTTLEATP